jgi:hypothetical protein
MLREFGSLLALANGWVQYANMTTSTDKCSSYSTLKRSGQKRRMKGEGKTVLDANAPPSFRIYLQTSSMLVEHMKRKENHQGSSL